MQKFLSPLLAATLLAATLLAAPVLHADIPLPSVTVFGTIVDAGGTPTASGTPSGIVTRAGVEVLEVEGEFVEDEGTPFFVLRIPVEAGVDAPGPSGVAAREGDVLSAIRLDGALVAEPDLRLSAGDVRRVNGSSSGTGGGDRFFRGDCDGDSELTLTDAVFTLGFLFLGGTEPSCMKACDSTNDNEISLTDAVFSLGFLFLGGQPLSPPTGGCGPAQGSAGLTCASTPCSSGSV